MAASHVRSWFRPLRCRWWAAAAPFLGLGCSAPHAIVDYGRLLPPAAAPRSVAVAPADAIHPVSHQETADKPESLPTPTPVAPAGPVAGHIAFEDSKPVPISLDAVLHLAEDQNVQIRLAREKLHQSEMENAAAQGCWLPNVTAGVAYYRHEGGIQNEDGTLTHSSTGALFPGLEITSELDLQERTYHSVQAERQMWQQKGELSRVTSENLIEASVSYLDLLLAQRAGAVSEELEKRQREVLEKAEAFAKSDPGPDADVIVDTTRTDLAMRRQSQAQLRQQAQGSAARLAYLLGLGPNAQPVPMDNTVGPVDLVDASPPSEELVAQALREGPAVRELEGMLAAIDRGLAASESLGRFLPVFKVNVLEGAFGAGEGGTLNWDNRLDVCVSAKWNLTDLFTAHGRKAVAESKREQAELTLQDVRGGLAARVREARAAILEGRVQIGHLTDQVKHASAAYNLSKKRFDKEPRQHFGEVLQSIRLLEQAHMTYLSAISSYNKAQVRLLVLLGRCDVAPTPVAH